MLPDRTMETSNPAIRVRPAGPADLPAIARLQAESPEASQWDVAAYLPDNCLVAESGGEVCAFIAARSAGGENEILNLAVAPSLRRRGIGRLLLAEALSRLSGPVFLEVRESNEAARRLYESAGFVAAGIRREYYGNPTECAIVMSLQSC